MINEFKAKKSNSSTQAAKNLLGKELEVKVTALDHQGQGVCKDQQPTVFVNGGIPGETLSVKVTQQKANVLHSEVKQVIRGSEHRVEPFCVHYQQCGGCQLQHIDRQAALDFKQQAIEQLLLHTRLPQREQKPARGLSKTRQRKATTHRVVKDVLIELPWQSPLQQPGTAYRRKTRLAIDARDPANIKLGYRGKQSSEVFSLTQCDVLEAPLQTLIVPLQQLFVELKRPANISHVSLLQGENQTQVCMRVVKDLPESDKQLLLAFAKQINVSLVCEDNQHQIEPLTDDGAVTTYSPYDKIKLQLHTDDFVQINGSVNQLMIEQAISWLAINEDDVVLDLFCGVGNFSLPLARHCRQVVGAEGVTKMVQRAEQNAQFNGIENCLFVHADLTQNSFFHRSEVKACNKVLLDPSREGAYNSVESLLKLAPSHLLYVSCNPATFVRDAAKLLSSGYQVEKIAVMDMFPYTAHTELMALFVPSERNKQR